MKKMFLVLACLISFPLLADMNSMKARVPKIVELKEAGAVGEKLDGLLGVIKDENGASETVQAENKDRLGVYKERAAGQGHTLATFMRVMGEERIKQEPAGRMIQNASGQWVKK